jgi:hypothetical protein
MLDSTVFLDMSSAPRETIESGRVVVTFYPQQWADAYGESYATASGSPIKFDVPAEDAMSEDGTLYEDDSYESDTLKDHPQAPAEVRDHEGPFYITLTA